MSTELADFPLLPIFVIDAVVILQQPLSEETASMAAFTD
jgi:hypothetical protein